jgi:copper chaperone
MLEEAKMETVKFHVPNISCGHCVMTIKREVSELAGVASVEGDPATKDVQITFAPPATLEGIKALLAEIGYPAA